MSYLWIGDVMQVWSLVDGWLSPLGPLLQSQWTSIVTAWPYGDRAFIAVSTWAVHLFTFWGLTIFYMSCDYFGWFSSRRLPGPKYPSREKILETVKAELVNHLLVMGPVLYLVQPYIFPLPVHDALPHWTQFVYQTALFLVINDVIFYFVHRTLHAVPFLYKTIHKKHHEYRSLVPISAEHANPIEDLLANILPTMMGTILFRPHLAVHLFFFFLRMVETCEAHSGYSFPTPFYFLHDPAHKHAFHHQINTGMYSAFGVMDWIFGTRGASYDQWLLNCQQGKFVRTEAGPDGEGDVKKDK